MFTLQLQLLTHQILSLLFNL